MKKLIVLFLCLSFMFGTVTVFGQVSQPKKSGQKKSGKKGGAKSPKKDSGKSAL